MHPMETQTTFRLPTGLARLLARRAKERGVSKAQLVREALEGYLTPDPPDDRAMMVRESAAGYLGSLSLNPSPGQADPLAAMIRERNWRE